MKVTIHAAPDNKKTILDLAEEQGISLPCNCHGANVCGGRQYDFPCGMVPTQDVTISLPAPKKIDAIGLEQKTDKSILPDCLLTDIGTTTVAMVFYNSVKHTVYESCTFPNPQRAYGTDVISRIKYDVEFHDDYTLKSLICDEISKQFNSVCSSNPGLSIRLCLIGGNTTMIHLLMGFPLDGMSKSPFTPYDTDNLNLRYDGTDVYVLPWLSAFIGGDITAGLLLLDFDRRQDTCLLADLGTNGELVLLHHGKLYTASTAAGPAFEGSGLSCGCPAIAGAIADIEWHRIKPKLQTIGNKLPTGICGSGAVSILSELITHGYVLPSGSLADTFPQDGILLSKTADSKEIRFIPDDVRQMQLAVAAIGAGISTLCKRAGISTRDISRLYLAGGLGHHISVKKAVVTGLFSDIPASNVISAGNSCLRGLAAICPDLSSLSRRTSLLAEASREIVLAHDPYFGEQFIHHMTYGDYLS